MRTAVHPLATVKRQLLEATSHDDAPALASLLLGHDLPLLGGHERPAELLYRSLAQPPVVPELPRRLSRLSARVLRSLIGGMKEADASKSSRKSGASMLPVPAELEDSFLLDLLLFSSFLPAELDLFGALKALHSMVPAPWAGSDLAGAIRRQLRQTLAYQQTDASFEDHWLGALGHRPSTEAPLDDEELGSLVDSWTGLLWVPPTPEQRAAATTVDIDRIARGLETLDTSLGGTPDHLRMLRWAVRTLDDAYPRDPRFWAEKLEPYLVAWESRELLLDVLVERWPVLEHLKARVVPTWNSDAVISHHPDPGGGVLIPLPANSPGYEIDSNRRGAPSESAYAAVDSEVSEVSEAPPDIELDGD